MSRLILLVGIISSWQGSRALRLGLVIEPSMTAEVAAVTYAVQFANAKILTNDTIDFTIYRTDANNSIRSAIQQTCALLADGNSVQIGPATSTNVGAVSSILSHWKIPIIAPVAASSVVSSFIDTIFMLPSRVSKGRAVAAIFKKMAWSRVNLLSSDDEYGSYGLLSFIEISTSYGGHITSMQSIPVALAQPNITAQLDTIKYSGCRITILNCLYKEAKYVLEQANSRGIVGRGWIWIVTNGVTNSDQFLSLDPVPQYLEGIIGTGYPALSEAAVAPFLAEWLSLDPIIHQRSSTTFMTASYWIDAVLAVAYAVRDYGHIIAPIGLSCFQSKSWSDGASFTEAIKNVSRPAVAQNIAFVGNYPSKTKYTIYNSRPTGWVEIATWDPIAEYQGVNSEAIILPGGLPASPDLVSSINGKHIRVVTIRRYPFTYYPDGIPPEDPNNIKPKIEIIGHSIDLLLEVSRIMNFTFTLYHVPDNKFGRKKIYSGYWNGIVGELVRKKADFAFGPLTVNRIRELDIEFSYPYMDLGLTFGLSKDVIESKDFGFMKPFHSDVWIGIGISMLLVGVALSFLEKLSPYGYHGEFVHKLHDMSKIKMDMFWKRKFFRRQTDDALSVMRMDNAVWFSFAVMIQQGHDRYPQAASSRIVSICWFLGILSLISFYTAQLGAVLVTSRLQKSVNTLQELYDQDKIRYGVGKDTSHEDFFCNSQVPLYYNMCKQMRKWNSWVYTSVQGLQWLQDPNYAYAYGMGVPVITAFAQMKPCTIRQLPEVFNPSGLGIGMQKGSSYSEAMTQTIIQLRENKFMDDLYTKWFTNKSECIPENRKMSDVKKDRAKLADLKRIFYVFILAACISPVLLLLEFITICIRDYKKASKAGISTNPCAIFFYRYGRIVRNFKLYSIPDSVKDCLGLHDFKLFRQRIDFQLRNTNNKRMEGDD